MRSLVLLSMIAACSQAPADDTSMPADMPRVEGMHDLTDRSALAAYIGTYGTSAADCSTDNVYMDEMIEVTDVGFAYQGELHTLAEIISDQSFRFTAPDGAEERIDFEQGSLVRWPETSAYRTIYNPCP